MKSTIYFSVCMFLVLCTTACRDEDRVRMPELQEGANMRVVLDPAKSSFKSSNLATSTVEFDAYSINTNLGKVEFIGSYFDKSANNTISNKVLLTLSQNDFANSKARGILTATQVATAFGLAGGINDIEKDDKVTIEPTVTLTDGRVFNKVNSAQSIVAGAYASFTVQFIAPVE